MGEEKKSKLTTNNHNTEQDVEMKETKVPRTDLTYDEKLQYVNEIASPMASRKLAKKCYKLVKAAVPKKSFTNGLKDVQTRIRKGDTG